MAFIGSLLVLVANDARFKFACPGFVSGKLSDLAGVAIVSLLLLTAFRIAGGGRVAPSCLGSPGTGSFLRYALSGQNGISFEVEALPNGIFLGTSGQEKADRIRHDLKSRLAASHTELEYVEPLKVQASR